MSLPDAPVLTAVVTGDNHLGTYYGRLRPDRLQARREALQAGFAGAVQVALDERAHLFLIAGDLFDRPDPRNADRAFVAEQFKRLRDARVHAVAICGNHDSPRSPGYDGGAVPLHEMAALDGLRLLRTESAWEAVRLDIETPRGIASVRIRGRSYDYKQDAGMCPLDTATDLDAPRTAPHEIVLLHYGVEGWGAFENDPVLSRQNLNRLGADLIAVGHLHARRHDHLPGGALLLNPGATERMDWGEEPLKTGCAVVHLGGGQPPRLRWHDTAPQPMQTIKIDAADLDLACDQSDAPSAATDYLTGRIEQAITRAGTDAVRQILRLRVVGAVAPETWHCLDLDAVRRFAAARTFHTDIDADELTVRYAEGDVPLGSGSFEIDEVIESIVAGLCAQATPSDGASDRERQDARRQLALLNGAKDALLGAYQRLSA